MDARTVLGRIAAVVGALGLVVLLPLYLSSGLAAPLVAVVLLVAIWLVFAYLAVRWFVKRPWLVLALPVVGAALWFATLTIGENFLGWQA